MSTIAECDDLLRQIREIRGQRRQCLQRDLAAIDQDYDFQVDRARRSGGRWSMIAALSALAMAFVSTTLLLVGR